MLNKIVKVFIVDDHKMFLEGVQSILLDVSKIKVIGTASNSEQVIKILDNFLPDVIITDVDMPNIDGIELTKIIKEKYPDIKIIAVSSHTNAEIISKAIKAGVNSYILKNTGKTELVKAIEEVIKNSNYFNQEIKDILENSLFNPQKNENESVKISKREIEILTLISQEKNTQEIAKLLFISVNTVEAHRKNLMRKIGTKNMVGLVKYAIKQGII